jgi:hypothetical protein
MGAPKTAWHRPMGVHSECSSERTVSVCGETPATKQSRLYGSTGYLCVVCSIPTELHHVGRVPGSRDALYRGGWSSGYSDIYTASRSIRLFPLVWYRIQYMVLPTTISLCVACVSKVGYRTQLPVHQDLTLSRSRSGNNLRRIVQYPD